MHLLLQKHFIRKFRLLLLPQTVRRNGLTRMTGRQLIRKIYIPITAKLLSIYQLNQIIPTTFGMLKD